MNLATVEKIAKAVLYEGYMLYPYRPSSVKNQQRFNFGVLFPQSYSEGQSGSDACEMQTECLVKGSSLTAVEIRLRFLQLVARSVGESVHGDFKTKDAPKFHLVQRLEAGGRVYQPWQEAIEREVILPVCNLESLTHDSLSHSFEFSKSKQFEDVRDDVGAIAGIIIREQPELHGAVDLSCERVGDGLFKVAVRIRNLTAHSPTLPPGNRDLALMSSLVSTHTVLGVIDGKFVSLLAPPDQLRELAAACKNVGTWPVLVGQEGDFDTLLSSPIILYDYPQIAPESAGDLFDGTEIDEILSLRIMTLTDDEKHEMSQSDERARQMLERTETMPVEQLMKLHGVLRGLRSLKEESQ
jgi:hydrogenase maturation protease